MKQVDIEVVSDVTFALEMKHPFDIVFPISAIPCSNMKSVYYCYTLT